MKGHNYWALPMAVVCPLLYLAHNTCLQPETLPGRPTWRRHGLSWRAIRCKLPHCRLIESLLCYSPIDDVLDYTGDYTRRTIQFIQNTQPWLRLRAQTETCLTGSGSQRTPQRNRSRHVCRVQRGVGSFGYQAHISSRHGLEI